MLHITTKNNLNTHIQLEDTKLYKTKWVIAICIALNQEINNQKRKIESHKKQTYKKTDLGKSKLVLPSLENKCNSDFSLVFIAAYLKMRTYTLTLM